MATVADVSTLTITAGTYEFTKTWNSDPSYDKLVLDLSFSSQLTTETETEIANALNPCTVKAGQYGGFTRITGYSIKPAVMPNINASQANKFLKVSNSGAYTQWADVFPTYNNSDSGKVLAVNSGATGVEWINSVPIEVVASLPANPTAGVLYIVTGA